MLTGSLLAVAFAVSALGVVLGRAAAPRLGLLDHPSHRKNHSVPVPMVGGIGVLLSVTVGLLLAIRLGVDEAILDSTPFLFLIGTAIAQFLVGTWDDRVDLPAGFKLALQIVICVAAMAGGVVVTELVLPGGSVISLGAVGYPLTLFWLLGMINAVNLIDGLDGLAGGIAGATALALAGFAIAMHLPVLAVASILILGGICGFLPFNVRQRAFLGDGGSMLAGYFLAGIAVLGAQEARSVAPMVIALGFMAVPVLDVASTIMRRVRRRASLFRADSEHIHHRLLQLGLTARATVLVLLGFTVFCGSQAVAVSTEVRAIPMLAGFGALAASLAAIHRHYRTNLRHKDAEISELFLFLIAAHSPKSWERFRAGQATGGGLTQVDADLVPRSRKPGRVMRFRRESRFRSS